MPFKSHYYLFAHQSGAALISIVGLLLGLITFALWMTSSTLLDEYKVQRNTIAFDVAMNQLQNEMNAITAQLHLSDEWQKTPVNTSTTASVISHQYLGNQNQIVTVFSITLTHIKPAISIKQQFVRYSALLQLPAAIDIPNGTSNTIERLFNRTSTTLSPHDFVAPSVSTHCNTLDSAPVIWVTGHCNINHGTIVSSVLAPVLIVIENGDLVIEDGVNLHGLVVIIANDNSHNIPTVTLKPSAVLKGGITSNITINTLLHGQLLFDVNILTTLQNLSALQKIQPIPGSWHDFN